MGDPTREQREAACLFFEDGADVKFRYPCWQRWIEDGNAEPVDPENRYDCPPKRMVRLAALLASRDAARLSAPDAPAAAGHSVELRERAADAAERLDGLSCALLMPHASSIGRGLPLTIGVFVGDDRIATFDGVEFCQDLVSVCHVMRRPDDSGAEDNNGE